MYPAAAALALAALVINTIQHDGVVNNTSLGLIALLLLIPVAEHLRRLKFGSVEAEFETGVRRELDAVERRVRDLTDQLTRPDRGADDQAVESGLTDSGFEAVARAGGEPSPARRIRRIVWVDDRPEGNALEVEELGKRFDVVTETSTAKGLRRISSDPSVTAVVSDAVRKEGEQLNYKAGLELTQEVRRLYPDMPVFIYCGEDTANAYGEELRAAGADLVTASFTELLAAIRRRAALAFEAELADFLTGVGNVRSESHVLDWIVELDGRTIGVEAKNWLRTPKGDVLDKTYARLSKAVSDLELAEAFLVAPQDVFLREQVDRAPDKVRPVTLLQLMRELDQ